MSDNTIEVDISGAIEKLKKAGVNVNVAVPRLVSRLLMQGERFMKRAVPVNTGYLRSSIYSQKLLNAGTITASAEYAGHVNWGTRPHVIRPRIAKVLAFPPKGARSGFRGGKRIGGVIVGGHRTGIFKFGGKNVNVGLRFAREVHHPGTRPSHFLEKTYSHIVKILPVETDLIINKATEGMQ